MNPRHLSSEKNFICEATRLRRAVIQTSKDCEASSTIRSQIYYPCSPCLVHSTHRQVSMAAPGNLFVPFNEHPGSNGFAVLATAKLHRLRWHCSNRRICSTSNDVQHLAVCHFEWRAAAICSRELSFSSASVLPGLIVVPK